MNLMLWETKVRGSMFVYYCKHGNTDTISAIESTRQNIIRAV